ncbi:hypothetical protein PVAG01_10435 [Phlyctema vagabunda]|uniref:Fibronectin type-III domain-containing protein n=1 Tax=Phlyctema vagabunda TaxID=108571 RepID=A0ABR4P5Z6_9HELO
MTTMSESTVSTNLAVWTAIQTSYLDVITVTTTDTNDVTFTSASTQYMSFVTTTTGAAGTAPTALIVAAVIAPASIAPLQPIVDIASGKTVAALGTEILSALAKEGILLTTPAPDVTAIVDPPYPDYLDFQVPIFASEPTPTSDDFAPTQVPPEGQQIALVSYINPIGDPAAWQRIFTYDSDKVSVLVANVLNGPDYVVNPNWKSVIDQAAAQGETMIGYVRTAAQALNKMSTSVTSYMATVSAALLLMKAGQNAVPIIFTQIYTHISTIIRSHIVYKLPQDQVATVSALAFSRYAGLLEVTDDDQPNPYDTLPNEAYMQAAIGAIAGDQPNITEPAEATGSYVAGLSNDDVVSSSDYSSVTLVWSPVGDSLGYAVYQDGVQVLELPATMTRATIGMIDPGTANIAFEVRTVLASGSGGTSLSMSASTMSLPSSGAITNVGFT